MPPIEKKLHSLGETRRTDASKTPRGDEPAVDATQVRDVERTSGVDATAQLPTKAAHTAIGHGANVRGRTPRGAGAKNASLGLGFFELARAKVKRGLTVAMFGIAVSQGGLAQALEVNGAVAAGDHARRATSAIAIASAQKSLSVATGPPPPTTQQPIVPGAVIALPDTPITFHVPERGRDTPLALMQADGTRLDVTRPRGDLPARLVERGDLVVEHGDDPGDYYCEHALFVQQRFAAEAGIVKNAHGETLTGFLHIPEDTHATGPADAVIDASVRYARHREVIGAAVFGFFHEAKKATAEDVRILITGYGPFMSITNNPAGGFVSDRDNIDAAMRHAFGDALVTARGELRADRTGAQGDETLTLAYTVKDGAGERRVVITAERLDVADHELSQDDPGSLVGAMRAVRPHAMLSLGVHGGSSFKVEHHADDGGLAIHADGTMTHDGSKTPSHAFLDNYALARAIWMKAQQGVTPEPRV